MKLDRRQVLAFRAERHGLARRRAAGPVELVAAVGAVGLRRTRNATLSLAARVRGVEPDDLAAALRDGHLVAFYGARGTIMMAPPAAVPALSAGTAPAGETSLRAAVPGAFVRHLDAAGITLTDALHLVVDAVHTALANGPLPLGDAAQAVTRLVPPTLAPPCRGRCPDPHVEDSLFRLAGVNGVMRFLGDDDVLVGTDPLPAEPQRNDFVRRYLSCYGPSKPAALAAWAGIGLADARRSLDALAGETVAVDHHGDLLRNDADAATTAGAEGVRLLPPFDPFLLDRDRDLLVSDRADQKAVWRASGNPGVVLVDGDPVATWRSRKRTAAGIAVEPFGLAPPPAVDEEVARIRSLL